MEGSWYRLSGGVIESSFLEIFKLQPDKVLASLLYLTLLQQRSWPRKPQEVPSVLNCSVICHPQLLLLRHNLRINRNQAQESLELSYSSDPWERFHCTDPQGLSSVEALSFQRSPCPGESPMAWCRVIRTPCMSIYKHL